MCDCMQFTQAFYEEGDEGIGGSVGGGEGGDSGAGTRVFPMEKLVGIVGPEKPQVCKTLIHLVMADSAYVENAEQGGFHVLALCPWLSYNIVLAALTCKKKTNRSGRH